VAEGCRPLEKTTGGAQWELIFMNGGPKMINLTSIQTLVDQTIGTLGAIAEQPELSSGVKDGLAACIATLKSISEDINDYEETRPKIVRPW